MAIIKTYPLKNNYYGPDRLILSDMQPDSLGVVHGTTKSLTLSNLKSFLGSGAAILQLTTQNTSGAASFDVNTNTLNIPDYSVGNVDGSGTAGRIPKWQDSNTLDNSEIFQSGSANIGIGTTGPSAKLQVNSTTNPQSIIGYGTQNLYIGVSGTNVDLKSSGNSTGTFSFTTGNIERVRITSGGNVGIGTTAPGEKLEVAGKIKATGTSDVLQLYRNSSSQANYIKFYDNATSSSEFYLGFTSNNRNFQISNLAGSGTISLRSGGGDTMILDSSQRVGIGTTTPAQKLTVVGVIKIDTSSDKQMQFARTGGDTFSIEHDSARMYFYNETSNNHTLTLLNGGNVGIGNTSPAAKLDVAAEDPVIRITNTKTSLTNGDLIGGLEFFTKDASTGASRVLSAITSSNTTTSAVPSGDLIFKTSTGGAGAVAATEKMRITPEGRVDINGDGSTNAGKLRLNCSANTHSVEIVGPDHSGGTSYSLKLPNSLPSVSNQILESNGAGALSWIPTPTGGGGSGGTVTSVGLSMPTAFSVSNSPITGNGSISVGVTGGNAGEFLDYQGNWSTPAAGTTSVTNGNPSASTGSALTISPNTGAVIVTSQTYAGTNNVGHVPAGGTASTFLRGDATWVTPTASLDFFKTISPQTGSDVVASGNDDTLNLVAGSNTGIFVSGSGSQITIGLSAPTALALGGIKLSSSAATTDLTPTYETATAGTGINNRVYPVQLNSANQAGVYVPWTGGSGGGISFSGTTSGGLATYTNSSTAGVSSKVTLNASGLIDLDADGNSAASIDYNPSGNRLQIGDFENQGAIVELYTDGSRAFQIGINGELGLGTTATQGTSGQVLTSQGNGSPAYWTNKTAIPSNNVTGAGATFDIPMWNNQGGGTGSYIGGGNGFLSAPFKSNASGESIISTQINGGITFRKGSGAQVKIDGGMSSGGAYEINLPSAVAASTNRVLGVNSVSGSLMSTAWVDPGDLTSITGTTSVNSSTFANTPFTFANTNAASGTGAPLATSVGNIYGNKHVSFYFGTTFSGAINQSGSSSVNYATSSDYRLKENVIDMTGSVDRLKQLKPSRFNFIADGPSRTIDGFLAHEVSSIVPEAITGSKDAIDAENNIIPQGIDQSKLVPLLVGAIKELTARIEALEA